MMDPNEKLDRLLQKIEGVAERHKNFAREIDLLRQEVIALKKARALNDAAVTREDPQPAEPLPVTRTVTEQPRVSQPVLQPPVSPPQQQASNLEKFIGENLISKIGILIMVIGVVIGVKYSIEHQLVSPLTRVVLGYAVAGGLLGLGVWLRKSYENYSAVLVSGAVALMYFITYGAHSFYDLLPQVPAFLLMVLFTAFAVFAALKYRQPVIAHLGLVGAYGIPFLLSDGSGRAEVFFGYMVIINCGILAISFYQYWKSLYYSSFAFTWLIFISWLFKRYVSADHLVPALVFLFLFFGLFYAVLLAYKVMKKEQFSGTDIVMLLLNTFVAYACGFYLLYDKGYAGSFTLVNAAIHSGVCYLLYRAGSDRSLVYLVSALVLTFITLSIPVKLDGNWVTLLWTGEAASLFAVARKKNIPFYERLSYPLLLLAFCSLLADWATFYHSYPPHDEALRITPVFNVMFLSSMLFASAAGYITYLLRTTHMREEEKPGSPESLMRYAIPAILVASLYFAFFMELHHYWTQLYQDSMHEIRYDNGAFAGSFYDETIKSYRAVWLCIYSLSFFAALSWFNLARLKSRELGYVSLALNACMLLMFLLVGLYELSLLRESFIGQRLVRFYDRSAFAIGIRYLCVVPVALALTASYYTIRNLCPGYKSLMAAFGLCAHAVILWFLSSELFSWMDIGGWNNSHKLGLSLLWASYAVLLIVIGILQRKKHLRIGAISLFGITLVKLFIYDLSGLGTVQRTILFVALGVLLLVVSFLYNKYAHLVNDEE